LHIATFVKTREQWKTAPSRRYQKLGGYMDCDVENGNINLNYDEDSIVSKEVNRVYELMDRYQSHQEKIKLFESPLLESIKSKIFDNFYPPSDHEEELSDATEELVDFEMGLNPDTSIHFNTTRVIDEQELTTTSIYAATIKVYKPLFVGDGNISITASISNSNEAEIHMDHFPFDINLKKHLISINTTVSLNLTVTKTDEVKQFLTFIPLKSLMCTESDQRPLWSLKYPKLEEKFIDLCPYQFLFLGSTRMEDLSEQKPSTNSFKNSLRKAHRVIRRWDPKVPIFVLSISKWNTNERDTTHHLLSVIEEVSASMSE